MRQHLSERLLLLSNKIAVLILTIVGVCIGLLTALDVSQLLFYTILALLNVVISLLVLTIHSKGIQVLVLLLIGAVTINLERFGVPVKADPIALGLLILLIAIKQPKTILLLRFVPLLTPAIGYVVVNLISSVFISPLPTTSLRQSVILSVRVITFAFIVISMIQMPNIRIKIPRFISWLLIVQTTSGILSIIIYSKYQLPFVYYGIHGPSTLSINGFFLEPNLFGIFSLCAISIIIPVYLFAQTQVANIPRFTFPVGIVGIVLSYTRSTWLGLILVALCLLTTIIIKSSNKLKKAFYGYLSLVTLLGIIVVVSVLLYTLLGGEADILERITLFTSPKDPTLDSASVRLITWKTAFITWQKSIWLGNGPLSSIAFGSTSGGWLFSSVVQTLHDSGLIGLFFMLWFCVGCMVYTLRAYFQSTDELDSGLLLGYFLAQISLFFTSQFSSFFWGGFTWVLLGLSVGHSFIVTNRWNYNSNFTNEPAVRKAATTQVP